QGMTESTSATSSTLARRVTFMGGSGVPAVAEAVDRVDGDERRVGGLELAADPLHVRSDRGVIDDDVRVAHELLALLHVAREARQGMDEPELGQRQLHGAAVPRGLEALHVELERAALEDLLGGWRLREQVRAP